MFKILQLTSILVLCITTSVFGMMGSDNSNDGRKPAAVKATSQDPSPHRNEDQFNFLSRQYPHLCAQAEQPYKNGKEENDCHTKLMSLCKIKQKDPGDVLLEEAKTVLSKNTLTYFGPHNAEIVRKTMTEIVNRIEEGHKKNGYFKVFFERAIANRTLVEEIVLVAEYMYQIINDQGGGTVLFVGRTPCVVQLAYEMLLEIEQDKNQHVVHLNFSGHPDAKTKRANHYFHSEESIVRNILTPEKVSHYFRYMDSKEALRNPKRVFLIDCIGSGGGMNSFLRGLNAYYQARGFNIPRLGFLCMLHNATWQQFNPTQPRCFTFTHAGDTINHGTMTFNRDDQHNIKPFEIETWGVQVFDPLIKEFMDAEYFQEFCMHGVHYPAQKWTPQFDEERDRAGIHREGLYNYLRVNFKNFIEYHKKKKG